MLEDSSPPLQTEDPIFIFSDGVNISSIILLQAPSGGGCLSNEFPMPLFLWYPTSESSPVVFLEESNSHGMGNCSNQ